MITHDKFENEWRLSIPPRNVSRDTFDKFVEIVTR